MAVLLYSILLLLFDLLLRVAFVAAQDTIQEEVWNVPSGQDVDFSNTFYDGNTVPISWNEYGGGNTASYDTLDLWVTTFDYTVHQYSQLLNENLTLNHGGTWSWTIDIPASQLQIDAKYVLRFKPPNSPQTSYNVSSSEISSPGILILQTSALSSTSTSSTSTSSTSTVATTSTASPTSSSSSSTTSAPASKGLSGGAEAGIGIGVAAAVLILFAIPLFFVRQGRKHRLAELPSASEKRVELASAVDGGQTFGMNTGHFPPMPFPPMPPTELSAEPHTEDVVKADS